MGKAYTKQQVLNAIRDSGAIISIVASRLDCSWQIARKYIHRWEATRIAFDEEGEQTKDTCEITIIDSVKNGDISSAKWYLSKKAKDRGYGDEPPVIDHSNQDIRIIIDDGH